MYDLAAEAVEEFRRRQILMLTNVAYARLRADDRLSRQADEEFGLWDRAVGDGLPRD